MSTKSPEFPRPYGSKKNNYAPNFIKIPEKNSKNNSNHGFLKSFDGTKLFYSVEGNGPPLIFCYGLVCSSLHWTYQIEYFKQKYKTVWFDYRGHQNSEMPKDPNTLSIPHFAQDLRYILDELKIEKAVFLGHSMGVNVVLDFYKLAPDRFAGLILANGAARHPLETLFHVNVFQKTVAFAKWLFQKNPKLIYLFWKLQKRNSLNKFLITLGGFNPHLASPQDIDLYVKQVMEMDPQVLIHLISNYDKHDSISWLHEISAPTLILAGQNDHIIPVKQQKLMHQLIPGSELKIVQHGSHCPQLDLPDFANLTIESFLNQISY